VLAFAVRRFSIRTSWRCNCPEPFDGIFCNASLFHVPSQELQRVLLETVADTEAARCPVSHQSERNNEEGFTDDRYACFFDLDTWRDYVTSAGFEEVGHYYRPPGLPRHKQPWLATVWRKRLASQGAA